MYPEEFVEHICLAIPLDSKKKAYVDNPLDNAVLLKRIGAKRSCTSNKCGEYELVNAVSGILFTFEWYKSLVGGHAHWRLQRMME